jgi:hypothetical protein
LIRGYSKELKGLKGLKIDIKSIIIMLKSLKYTEKSVKTRVKSIAIVYYFIKASVIDAKGGPC